MFIFFVVHLEMLFLIYLTIAFFVIQFWEELLTKWNEEKNDISWMKETKKSITSPYSLFCIYISSSIVKLILHQIINFLRKTVLQCTVKSLYNSNSIESWLKIRYRFKYEKYVSNGIPLHRVKIIMFIPQND